MIVSFLKRGALYLLFMGTLCSCTINIYHAAPAESGVASTSLLSIPKKIAIVEPEATNGDVSGAQHFSARPGLQDSEPDRVLSMRVDINKPDATVNSMSTVELTINMSVDAYLNCYYQQADGHVFKVFPNRYSPRYWVYAGQKIRIPDDTSFKIVKDTKGVAESFMCLVSKDDVLLELPKPYQANVFQSLPVDHFDALYQLYRQSTSANLLARVVNFDAPHN